MTEGAWIAIGAIGTWALAIAAIWGDRVKAQIFRPRLSVDLLSKSGSDLIPARFGDGSTAVSRYYHLRVTNTRQHSPALKVQIVISRIAEPGPDGKPQVRLTEALPLRWRHQEYLPLQINIGHEERHADLISVNERKQLILLTLFQTFNLKQVYTEKTELWITARAQGENCASDPFVIHIAWDGEWDKGKAEMEQHLQISVTPAEHE